MLVGDKKGSEGALNSRQKNLVSWLFDINNLGQHLGPVVQSSVSPVSLTLLHSELPKLHRVLAILSTNRVNLIVSEGFAKSYITDKIKYANSLQKKYEELLHCKKLLRFFGAKKLHFFLLTKLLKF